MKKKFHFAIGVFIGGMLSAMLISCAARGVKTASVAQTNDAQQSANPTSIETFSAFLDRC